MSGSGGDFDARARRLLRERPGVREAVTAAATTFDAGRRAAWSRIDARAWRDWAEGVKNHALGRLDEHLRQAEARLAERGARVHWAATGEDALEILGGIVEDATAVSLPGSDVVAGTTRAGLSPPGASPGRAPVRRGAGVRVVKGKSMLSEELGVNPFLEARGVEVVETDLGEFIIQLLGESPATSSARPSTGAWKMSGGCSPTGSVRAPMPLRKSWRPAPGASFARPS